MKKTLLICGALLAFIASSAMAAGQIHLSVTECSGGGGLQAATMVCTTNGGAPLTLIGSVIPPVSIPLFDSMDAIVDMAMPGAVLSPWWHVETGGCRATFASMGSDFTLGPFGCNDIFVNGGSGGSFLQQPSPGTGLSAASLRYEVFYALASTSPVNMDAALEHYMFKISLLKAKTVGTGSCAGCGDAANFYFNGIALFIPTGAAGVPETDVSGDGVNQGVSVNNGTLSTAARHTSWGSIKALYR